VGVAVGVAVDRVKRVRSTNEERLLCGQDKDKSVHTNKQMTHEGNAFGAKSVSFVRHLFVRMYTFVGLCASTPGMNKRIMVILTTPPVDTDHDMVAIMV
jgi:hypothetical protein